MRLNISCSMSCKRSTRLTAEWATGRLNFEISVRDHRRSQHFARPVRETSGAALSRWSRSTESLVAQRWAAGLAVRSGGLGAGPGLTGARQTTAVRRSAPPRLRQRREGEKAAWHSIHIHNTHTCFDQWPARRLSWMMFESSSSLRFERRSVPSCASSAHRARTRRRSHAPASS
jgi:hypothetical protein